MSVTAPDLLYSTPDMAEIPYLALELELFEEQKNTLKEKKSALKKAEKELTSLEAKKAKADAKAAEEAKKAEAEAVLKKLLESGMSADEIFFKKGVATISSFTHEPKVIKF